MDPKALSEQVTGWLTERLPASWFTRPAKVSVDNDEILVVGELPAPPRPRGTTDAAAARACLERVKRFREETREQRIRIAGEAEHRFGRKVSWGAACGDQKVLFTSLSIPVMTRLRLPERAVLDTLIEAGVARSRSDALAWCVRLVGSHQADWIRDLQAALEAVQRVRAAGPASEQE
ncbi:MAG TPA: hypothetical protein VGM21_16675 [Actinomycetota bacterium]|jgi:hypothetical protein